MKLLINATALSQRGAYSLLKAFVEEMNRSGDFLKNEGIYLHFLVSRKELCDLETSNIIVKYEPVSKESVFHKWKYEKFTLPQFVRKEGFDAYLSLQNYVLKNIDTKQFALIHQPIPFSNLHFSELEFSNWLKYKIIYSRILRKQTRFIDGVIVQTQWMKDAVISGFGYKCPVRIIRPEVEDIQSKNAPLDGGLLSLLDTNTIKLFYPTSSDKYKNNDRLVKAVDRYNENSEKKVTLYITLEGENTEYVKFTGKVPFESIFTFYSRMNALIFPSLTETMGFPLLEAQQCELPIITADLPFGSEICGENAYYFEPRSIASIVAAIEAFVANPDKRSTGFIPGNTDKYLDYIKFIKSQLI